MIGFLHGNSIIEGKDHSGCFINSKKWEQQEEERNRLVSIAGSDAGGDGVSAEEVALEMVGRGEVGGRAI